MKLDWIAGFFDGEGSASLRIARNKTCKYGFQVLPEATIGQRTQPILAQIQRCLGFGRLYRNAYRNKKYGWQLVFHSRADINRFLALMQTRSILKRRQLALLGQAMKLLSNSPQPGARFRGASIPRETMRKLLVIAEEFRGLNYTKHGRTVDLSELRQQLDTAA